MTFAKLSIIPDFYFGLPVKWIADIERETAQPGAKRQIWEECAVRKSS